MGTDRKQDDNFSPANAKKRRNGVSQGTNDC